MKLSIVDLGTVAPGTTETDALADALLESGALSASIEDADAGTDRETPQFGEYVRHIRGMFQSMGLIDEGARAASGVESVQ